LIRSTLYDVDELELLGPRGRFGRCRNQAYLLVTNRLQHADHERIANRNPRKYILKGRSDRMADRMCRQHTAEPGALLAEARRGLGRQASTRGIATGRSQHFPAHHRAMTIFCDPELKHVILRAQGSIEELIQSDFTRESAVPVLRMLLANSQHALEVTNPSLTDEESARRWDGGRTKHWTGGYIPTSRGSAMPPIGLRQKGLGYGAIVPRGS